MNHHPKIRVAAICGSLRPGSYTRQTLIIALQGAEQIGAETQLLDLVEYDLAFCNGNKLGDNYPADVSRWRTDVSLADGLILGTPEYHGSFSGVLKNALDLLGCDELEGKMIGLIGVSGGEIGAINALNSLRNIGRALHAWVIPEQVTITRAWQKFDSEGQINDPKLASRVRDVGRQVARFAYLHRSHQTREFLQAWENAPPNPGGNLRAA